MKNIYKIIVLVLYYMQLVIAFEEYTIPTSRTLARNKRYLLYPNGDPARVQLIIGVGLPVDLEDESVTMGYVIKILYHIPQNSTDYTSPIFSYAPDAPNARSHRNKRRTSDNAQLKEGPIKREANKVEIRGKKEQGYLQNAIKTNANTLTGSMKHPPEVIKQEMGVNKTREDCHGNVPFHIDNDDNNLNSTNFKLNNVSSFLSNVIYTEGGKYITDIKAVNKQPRIMESELYDNKKFDFLNRPKTSRWDIYRILEHMVDQNGLSGRACILRTICEAADTPFTYRNGLLGELMHIIFTPSSSLDRLSKHADNEYHAAEKLGADERSDCEALFPECNESILDMFSQVGVGSLFG